MSRRQMVMRSRASFSARSSAWTSSAQGLELLGASDERTKIEAEGELELPCPIAPGVALPVGAVAPDYDAGVDQHGEVPAQCRWRHAVRAERQLRVGWEDDQSRAAEDRLRVEGQERVEDGQRSLGDADLRFGRADRTEDVPLVHGLFGRARVRDNLACDMGKRQLSPPEGRR